MKILNNIENLEKWLKENGMKMSINMCAGISYSKLDFNKHY